jgi:carboxyl-terminal processing protease
MVFSRKIAHIIIVFTVIAIGIFGFKTLDDGDDFELAKSFDIFHNIVREIRMFYVDDIDASKLINQASEEFLMKLDPYTVYYPESQMEEFEFMTTGAYGGIGAGITEYKDRLLITDIKQGSPSDLAGIKVGDIIKSVNRIAVIESNASEVKELIKGEPGSSVLLKIKRYGSEDLIEISVKREKIQLDNIPFAFIINNKYAYVQLNQFNQNAGSNLNRKLHELKTISDFQGIILDLRGNPGGLLMEAVHVAGLFLPKNSSIVFTKGRISEANYNYKTTSEPTFPDIPVVVLINRYSASASEIVAGALQDYDRAVIIGQRSYGKGLVQLTRKMNYNTRIKLTTAKYYIPSGRCIQAIDYTHRNPDGSVGQIPDSLISLFKTKNGREVYDGGGINPDIIIKIDSLSTFTKDLIKNMIIFDFSNQYAYNHPSIDTPDKFIINDAIIGDFKDYLEEKNFKFISETEIKIDNLLESAINEKYNPSIISQIQTLQTDLVIDPLSAVDTYKNELIPILWTEIMKRYYPQKEIVIGQRLFDIELDAGIHLLENVQEYKNVLSGIRE